MAKYKHKKKSKISIAKIIGLLLFLVSAALTVEVFILDILPTKYLIIFIGVILFLNLIVDVPIFKKGKKKKLKNTMAVFGVLLIIAFSLAIAYIAKTMGFLDNFQGMGYKIENYSVVVKKSSNYKKLKDIDGLSVGYYSKTVGASKANKKLGSKIEVTFDSYDDALQMANKLLGIEEETIEDDTLTTKKKKDTEEDDELEVIVVEDSILSMMKEEVENFEDDTRVIYRFKVKIKVNSNKKEVDVTSKAFNVYISGIDTFGEISSVSRSDVNMVATINPKTKQILLTSIPRDYYVKLHTYKAYDKLTHAGMYGVDESIKTIEDLLNIDINYYLKVNFTSVIDIVNSLGGLKVYSDYDFVSEDKFKYTKGYNQMNGEQALSFARERHAFKDGDRQRVKDQQAVFAAIIKKVCSKSILTKYSSLLNSVEGKFDTNMSTGKIKSLVKMQLDDMATWTVTSVSLEGYDSSNTTYSAGAQRLYVMNPDEGSVADASQLIASVINGKKLKGTYELETSGTSNVTSVNTSDNTKNSTNDNSVSATTSCTSGYTLSADKTVCTKTESVKPETSCTSGELTTDGYCMVVVGSPTCDPDNPEEAPCEPCSEGTLTDGKCVKKTSANPTCSMGYKLNGNLCSKTTSISPSYSCPKGYKLSGKTCTK